MTIGLLSSTDRKGDKRDNSRESSRKRHRSHRGGSESPPPLPPPKSSSRDREKERDYDRDKRRDRDRDNRRRMSWVKNASWWCMWCFVWWEKKYGVHVIWYNWMMNLIWCINDMVITFCFGMRLIGLVYCTYEKILVFVFWIMKQQWKVECYMVKFIQVYG